MAFFYQAKRNTDFPIKNGPAPSQYNTLRQTKKNNAYAPFGSTTKLNRTIKKQQKFQLQPQALQEQKQALFDQSAMKALVQDQMASVFKSRSQRFISSFRDGPGPGSYNLSGNNTKKNKSKSTIQNNRSNINIQHTTPSMPLDNLGYKFDKDNAALKVKEKTKNVPAPGSYQLRKQLIKQNGLLWNDQKTSSKKKPEDPTPGPGQYNSLIHEKKAPTSCFNSKNDRFNQKSIRKTYRPGPGDYNPSQHKLNHHFSQSHFNSKALRFKPSVTTALGPGSYHPQRSKSMNGFKNKSMGNRTNQNQSVAEANRKTIFSLTSNKNPGPGNYIHRDGMTFQLQKALLRKHNLSQFANSKRQVFAHKDEDEPGPGAYNPELPEKNSKGSLASYKKVQVVNLKQDDDEGTPSPMDYTCNNFTIQKKISDYGRKITLTEKKPFDSGAERFRHYNNNLGNNGRYPTFDTDNQSNDQQGQRTGMNMSESAFKKTKKLIMTSVKVKVPFGSSAPKYQDREQQEPGPGAYDSNSSGWLKNTFNIKGKLRK